MIKVGVFGAAGRMGALVCRTVMEDPDLQLVAAVDPQHHGLDLRQVAGTDSPGLRVSPTPEAMTDAGVDVAIDFTQITGARENVRFCAEHAIHSVVGTSGFTESDHETLRAAFTRSNCLIAPNFAIGAVLMMRFAELSAPWFDTAEIIELHHDGKIDAPSSTAVTTAERLAAASPDWADDPTEKLTLDGPRGAISPSGPIRIHSVRMRGIVASQEVILGTTGQTLTVRHDTTDRSSFMPGVLLACKRIADFPGVTVGLDAFLGL